MITRKETHFVISGGFGDCINQIAKINELHLETTFGNCMCIDENICKCNNIIEEITVTYIRDTIDDKILEQANHLTKNYVSWVTTICELQGYKVEVLYGDQRELCEKLHKQYPEWIILGPNMDYSLKIWEPQRKMYVGIRPFEKEYVVKDRVYFYDRRKRMSSTDHPKLVTIQVRFGSEYPTKVPNASWNNVEELVNLVKHVKTIAPQGKIALVGETKQNIGALEKVVDRYCVNAPVEEQYYAVRESDLAIGFSGWFCNLSSLCGIETLRMFWDEAETKLQIPPFAYKYITHFTHANLMEKL